MKKAILLSEELYNKMVESYDAAVEELQTVKYELQQLREKSRAIKLVEPDEGTQDFAQLEELFEMCRSVEGCTVKQPEPLRKILDWFVIHADHVPADIGERLTETLAGNEMQWFANGFRCAMAIWRTC